MVTSIGSLESPIVWEIEEKREVVHPTEILKLSKTLQFLERHPEWMQKKEKDQLAKDIANKVFTTKVPSFLKQQTGRIRCVLANIPWLVRIKVDGKIKGCISKETLLLRSELFRSALTHTDTGKENLIALDTQRIGKQTIQRFLDFLRNGKVGFGDDVYDLYHLAASYNVVKLQEQIEIYLEENITEESLTDVYKFATVFNSENVLKACFRFVMKNSEVRNKIKTSRQETESKVLLNSVEIWEKDLIQKCSDLNIEISFKYDDKLIVSEVLKKIEELEGENTEISEFQKEYELFHSQMLAIFKNYGMRIPPRIIADMLEKIKNVLEDAENNVWQPSEDVKMLIDPEDMKEFELEISRVSEQINKQIIERLKKSICENGIKVRLSNDLTPDVLEVIKEIQDMTEILELRLNSLNEANLQELLEIKVNPRKLFINQSSIKEVPQIWQQSVELLSCRMCSELMTLKATQANKILVENCPNLKSLEAPKANFVSVSFCEELTNLDVSNAIEINISECESLNSLKAPSAEAVNVRDCESLKSLDLPKAVYVDCYENCNLNYLNVPNASFVNYRQCPNLVHLKIKEDIDIKGGSLDFLETLEIWGDLPVWVNGYPKLEVLSVHNATEVKINSCRKLIRLIAPKAIMVKINNCGTLHQFEAPNAKIECLQTQF